MAESAAFSQNSQKVCKFGYADCAATGVQQVRWKFLRLQAVYFFFNVADLFQHPTMCS